MTAHALALTTEALNALASHIAILDATGVIVLVNRAWARFAQSHAGPAGAAPYIGANYLAICRNATEHGDTTADAVARGIEDVLRGTRETFSVEYPCGGPGEDRWFHMSVTRFEVDSQRYLVVAHNDITSRKQHERELEASRSLLASVLEALPVGVWILDRTGAIVQGNAAGREIWAGARYVGPSEFGKYKGWWLDTGKPIAPEEWAAARAITRGETSLDEEIEIEAFDGARKIIANSALPLFDAEHRIAGAIIVNQEITARKRAEAEREALLAERDRLWHVAEEANRGKDEFIATLSHELRTPLQAVLGWATLLKQGSRDGPAVARAAAALERNARIVAQMLDDTLDVNRISRGKLSVDRSRVDLTAIVADVLESMRPAFAENEVTLAADFTAGPVIVDGDPIRLQQIVWNLLNNALKFTPAGGRTDVRTDCRDGWGEVEVSDSGIGIAPEFLPFVFDRYRQSGSAPAGGRAGLGLGLAIVRELVHVHGGTIAVESAGESRGTTFRVRLPAAAASANHAS
jgi:signal transduction histidine kinase